MSQSGKNHLRHHHMTTEPLYLKELQQAVTKQQETAHVTSHKIIWACDLKLEGMNARNLQLCQTLAWSCEWCVKLGPDEAMSFNYSIDAVDVVTLFLHALSIILTFFWLQRSEATIQQTLCVEHIILAVIYITKVCINKTNNRNVIKYFKLIIFLITTSLCE